VLYISHDRITVYGVLCSKEHFVAWQASYGNLLIVTVWNLTALNIYFIFNNNACVVIFGLLTFRSSVQKCFDSFLFLFFLNFEQLMLDHRDM